MSIIAKRCSFKQLSKLPHRSSHFVVSYMCGHRRFSGDNNSNGLNSCITDLQSVSHALYHKAVMMDIVDGDTSKSLMALSQKIDQIVLKLNIEQNKTCMMVTSGETQSTLNIQEEDIYVATQEEVNEINREMEDLFGTPMSKNKIKMD